MFVKIDKRLLLKWVTFSAIGWFTGQFIGTFITSLNYPEAEISQLNTSPLYWLIFGSIFGFSQWLSFQDRIPGMFKWVLFTGGSLYLAAICAKLLNISGLAYSKLFVQLVGSMIFGYGQFLVLRQISNRATFWIPTVIVGWVFTQQFIDFELVVFQYTGIFLFTIFTGFIFSWLIQEGSAELKAT